MIAKISRGSGMGGLLHYLMGPGRYNEHVNQRVIASWDGAPELHQPLRNGSACGFDVRDLARDLNDAALAAGMPTDGRPDGRHRGPVWHCSLRNAPGDRPLSDAEWAEVVEDLMDRTGIARRGDDGGCRWVVIRHADDHVHVAAMLVRMDNGRRVHPRNDFYRAREVCRDAERRFGLTATAPADRTAAPAPSRAEFEKAARRESGETSREWLRRAARTAAVQAQDPEAFFRRLADLGVLVRPREMPPGQLVGYAVAAPGDVNAAGLPVWFGGRRLAPDLSLPALRARWKSAPPPADPIPPALGERSTVGRAERAAAVADATRAAQQAASAMRAGDPTAGASVPHAAADLLTALCGVTERSSTSVPWAAADGFDRAARTPFLRQPRRWAPVAQELRRAAWRLAAVRSTGRGHDDDTGLAELVVALAMLAAEIAAYYEARRFLAQAAAARRTDHALRQRATVSDRSGAAGLRPPGRGGPRRPNAAGGASTADRPTFARGPASRGPGGVRDTEQKRGRSR